MKLTVENLTMSYPSLIAVDNLSFEVPDGRLSAILGPSGCGKSTLLSGIAGIRRPDGGEIRLGERLLFSSSDGTDVPPEHRRIGFVFQNYALWPHMNVNRNILYPLRVRRENPETRKKELQRILSLIRLEEKGHRYPGELSGGERQRVALGRALIMNPDLLLLDEPLSNLDARLREDMQEEIRRIQRSLGLTVVHVTHDQSEALAMSDEVIIMEAGHIVQRGLPEEIYDRPNSLFSAHFVGTSNIIDEGTDTITVIRPEDIELTTYDINRTSGPGDSGSTKPTAESNPLPHDSGIHTGVFNTGENPAVNTGIVIEKLFRGAHFLYVLQIPGGELKVQAHPTERFDIGDRVIYIIRKSVRVPRNTAV